MINRSFKVSVPLILIFMLVVSPVPVQGLDTDIYQFNVKQNCYILLDSSDSMGFGVYESNVDYAAMFDYLFTLNDSGNFRDYIYDTVNDSATFYNNREWGQHRIYLIPGAIGIGARREADGDYILDENGNIQLFSGDAADPGYVWRADQDHVIDTYTDLTADGDLVAGDATNPPRLTTDSDGYVLFDGARLPQSQNILKEHRQVLYGGGVIEDGFGDLLNAPGYYFSGYTDQVDDIRYVTNNLVVAGGGESVAYFFITGNWLRMQSVYNLTYTTNNPTPSGAHYGDEAWKFERFPVAMSEWPTITYNLDVPAGNVDYGRRVEIREQIVHPGAAKMRVHFDVSLFDVADGDYVSIATESGTIRYDNTNLPAGWDGWTPLVDGDTVEVVLRSNPDSTVGAGYLIDQYAYIEDAGGYLMKNRLGVATTSILNTIEEFRGKINWGTFTFPVANGADGATSQQVINPTLSDDASRQNIESDFGNIAPADKAHGTPMGEALQEVFEVGYYQHRSSIDNLSCRKNYSIVLSDGYPSNDDNWGLIDGVTFEDFDEDGFRADPYSYLGTNPPENYYDDVANWMYTHSWHDKSEVTDPASSYENVSSHQISFGVHNPLMQDAADEAGGMYIAAYNEGQLNAAFYAIGLAISEAVSFTAPVVSVDEANKVQNGDDLYMGQFYPMDSGFWPGNLRKYRLGDGTTDRPDFWGIYDSANSPATDLSGQFVDDGNGFWGDENDANDRNSNDVQDIQEDGVGEVLTERVAANFANGNYLARRIKTYIDTDGDGASELVDFDRTHVAPTDVGQANDTDADNILTRDKIVNFVHGYSYDADPASGNPVATREWALGAIIHSRPTVIDYYDNTDYSILSSRYIAVGADDGMLHVFNDADGSEVFAFVPTDVLGNLPLLADVDSHTTMVDGYVRLFREDGQPKYLFFGLRRGGRSYWRIDISDPNPVNWTVARFADGELGQSWSDVEFAKIQIGADGTGDFADVAIFTGGYDVREDNFPEPFDDLDNNGTPYASNGSLDNQEWRSSNSAQDLNGNGSFDIYNPGSDTHGRAIYVVDVHTLAPRFTVKYGSTNAPAQRNTFSTETEQTRSDMLYCFPATPSVVTLSKTYSYVSGGNTEYARQNNVLAAIYAIDIYGNLFRIVYDYDGGVPKWKVNHVFSANPGSDNDSGDDALWQSDNTDDQGRKVFYGPAVSWRGSGRYFDPSNYAYSGKTFHKTNEIASLFFGTGDREHPAHKLVSNRVYAIYDDSPVYATDISTVPVSSVPYKESDLLNLTCDELGVNTTLSNSTAAQNSAYKQSLETVLFDDVVNSSALPMELDSGGGGENDAKGWYIILEKQGLSPYCDHCDYPATVYSSEGGRDYHFGEKVLSKMTLFAGNLYFTSYQPSYDDPCQPEGNAFTYALNYLNGAAALNLNVYNDVDGSNPQIMKDVTDRYGKYTGVKGIPSGFEVVIRDGKAAALSSVGGAIKGGGEGGGAEIPYEDFGLNLNYWIER